MFKAGAAARRFLLAVLIVTPPAWAQTLAFATGAPPTSIDPHFHTLTPNANVGTHLFGALVERDAQARLRPGLAESWRLVNDTTWEFKLRKGVTFHNGEPFTAEDVVFTIERVPNVPNSPASYAVYTKPITRAEIVDPWTIRFSTAAVHPLLPTDLSQIHILTRSIAGHATTADFNSGRAAIGTGPYRLVSYSHGDRLELARNEAYWGEKPAWERVDYRIIGNDAARVAALRSGDVQLIDGVPTGDIARLRGEEAITLSEATSLRMVYLRVDVGRDVSPYVTGPNGEKLDRNPLKDPRVRAALSMAINRDAIVDRVMSGAALATGQPMPPGTYGHIPDLKPPAYDPARAKQLLAEAGWPDGFGITLIGSNDRYINDAQIIQAVGQMWARIGVNTKVEAMPYSAFSQRNARSDLSAALGGWSNVSGEPSSGLRALLMTRDLPRGYGTANRSGYSNPDFDKLVMRAMVTTDDTAREQVFMEATRMAMADHGLIPLHIQKNVWAMRKGLVHDPRADEMTLAMGIRPAP